MREFFFQDWGKMQMAVPSICGDMLLWVANASGSLLSAMVPSEPAQTNQHCPPSCLAWNPLLQVATGFPLFQTFLQWDSAGLASFLFILSISSFHLALPDCFVLSTPPTYLFTPLSLPPPPMNSKFYAAVFRG